MRAKTAIIEALLIVMPGFAADTQFYISQSIEKVQIQDTHQSELTVYSLYGVNSEKRLFNRIFSAADGLASYEQRAKTYEQVLKEYAINPHFVATDFMQTMVDLGAVQSQEQTVEWAGLLAQLGELRIAAAQFAGKRPYIGTGIVPKYLNQIKKGASSWRIYQLKNFKAAVASLGVATDVISLGFEMNDLVSTIVLYKSLQVDMAINRIEFLKTHTSITDAAFSYTANKVLKDLEDYPEDSWLRLYEALKNNRAQLERVAATGASLGVNIYSLATASSSTAAGLGSVAPWIGAGLFAWDTYKMTEEHRYNLRAASLAATLYKSIQPDGSQENLRILEDLQFYFLQTRYEAFDNWTYQLLSAASKSWAELRQDFKQNVEEFTQTVMERRAALWSSNSSTKAGPVNNCATYGFIIDSSGSMRVNDRSEIRKEALMMILDQVSPQNDVFLVEFDDKANWLNPQNWNNWDLAQLRQAVAAIDSRGGTNLGNGLNSMRLGLEKAYPGSISNEAGVLLLSDGIGDYSNEADWFSQRSIPVFTVSFSGDENAALLSRIASITDGEYLKANTSLEIVNAFNRFFSTMSGKNKIFQVQAIVAPFEKKSYTFPIEGETNTISASCVWTGSTVGLALIDPQGRRYENSMDAAVWNFSKNYVTGRVSNPMSGFWTAEIMGKDVPLGGEAFSLEINSNSHYLVNLKLLDDTKTGTLTFQINSNFELFKINNRQISIHLINPQNEIKDISSFLQRDHFAFSPDAGPGTYKSICEIQGEIEPGMNFMRILEKTFYVGDEFLTNIGRITKAMGSILTASVGAVSGNRPGMKCYIYRDSRDIQNKIAEGVVTSVRQKDCLVQLQRIFNGQVTKNNDIIEIDVEEWKRDRP